MKKRPNVLENDGPKREAHLLHSRTATHSRPRWTRRPSAPCSRPTTGRRCLRRLLSAPDGLGEELVGLSKALDEEASDCLVEGVLARVGGGAKGGGADLDHGYLAGGGNGGGTAGGAAGGGEKFNPGRARGGVW